jgi:hypothetical protein
MLNIGVWRRETMRAMAECFGVSLRQWIDWALIGRLEEGGRILGMGWEQVRHLTRKERAVIARGHLLLKQAIWRTAGELRPANMLDDMPLRWLPPDSEAASRFTGVRR